jgi:hypothetical protein
MRQFRRETGGILGRLGEAWVRLPAGDELAPLHLLLQIVVEGTVGVEGRPGGLADEVHVCFTRGATGLAVVAVLTGGDDVIPVVLAAAIAGEDVVEGEVTRAASAVLAGVAVAQEDIAAAEASAGPRSSDYVDETDNGGDLKNEGGATQVAPPVLQHLGFASVHQDEGATRITDVERFVILIKNQYGCICHSGMIAKTILCCNRAAGPFVLHD